VLNHSWEKKETKDNGIKKGGIARRGGGLAENMGLLSEKASESKGGKTFGTAGKNLVVDTGGSSKSRFSPSFEEDSPAVPNDSPPTSPGEGKSTRRGGAKANATVAPVRRYQNDVCPDEANSPRLRDPPGVRKGQIKLDFEHGGEEADAEHAQCEVDDHLPHMDPAQQHFVDLCHHMHGAVNQCAVRLGEMLQNIRNHFMADSSWLDQKEQFEQLTEICFELQTSNYFLAKWHHQLDRRNVPAPTRPSKEEDMNADDILAQCLYSISKMEVLAGKLCPVLEKICHDAKTLRRGPNGEPLTPTSKNALTLAKKHGFQDLEGFYRLLGHLEHILAIALHLSHPPDNGLPEMKKAATVVNAALKFKKGLMGKKLGSARGEEKPTAAASAIGGAFSKLGAAAAEDAAAPSEG